MSVMWRKLISNLSNMFQLAAGAQVGARDEPAGRGPGREEGGDGQQGGEAPEDGEALAGEREELRPLLCRGSRRRSEAEQVLLQHEVMRVDCNVCPGCWDIAPQTSLQHESPHLAGQDKLQTVTSNTNSK